jgi:hypothetical protein
LRHTINTLYLYVIVTYECAPSRRYATGGSVPRVETPGHPRAKSSSLFGRKKAEYRARNISGAKNRSASSNLSGKSPDAPHGNPSLGSMDSLRLPGKNIRKICLLGRPQSLRQGAVLDRTQWQSLFLDTFLANRSGAPTGRAAVGAGFLKPLAESWCPFGARNPSDF